MQACRRTSSIREWERQWTAKFGGDVKRAKVKDESEGEGLCLFFLNSQEIG